MTRNPRALVYLPAAFLAGLLILTHSQCTPKLPRVPVSGAIEPLTAPFAMPQLVRPPFPEAEFDIRDFGAIEGGTAKNTGAIREAIAVAAHAGGGHVLIPPGTWLTGAIHLESNIDLHLLRGAELLFSQDPADYLPVVFARHEDVECYKYSAFIYAEGKSNIAVTGEGVLNGQGKPWWAWKQAKRDAEKELYAMGANNVPVAQRIFDGKGGLELRPAFFQPVSCTNVLVEGVTFRYGAFWTLTPTYCENVIIRNVHIETEGPYGHTPNGDGVDPSSCRNVLIEHCTFDTGDDCIAIKAGRDADGLRVGRPTENVVIRHCRGLRGHGGIVIGSETSGGIRNIYAHDCQFAGTDRIVRIKTARGRGGVLENMWFRTLAADTIELEALHINMLYTGTRLPEAPVTKATPVIRNIHYSNITCKFAKGRAVEILGLPESPVELVSLDSITMNAVRGIACTDAQDITLEHVSVMADSGPALDLTDCHRVTLDSFIPAPHASPFIEVRGAKSGAIVLKNVSLRGITAAVRIGRDVPPGAVEISD